jgi:hypothetical protein
VRTRDDDRTLAVASPDAIAFFMLVVVRHLTFERASRCRFIARKTTAHAKVVPRNMHSLSLRCSKFFVNANSRGPSACLRHAMPSGRYFMLEMTAEAAG